MTLQEAILGLGCASGSTPAPKGYGSILSLYEWYLRERVLLESEGVPTDDLGVVILWLQERLCSLDEDLSKDEATTLAVLHSFRERMEAKTRTQRKPHQRRRPSSALSRAARHRWIRYQGKYRRAFAKAQQASSGKSYSRRIESLYRDWTSEWQNNPDSTPSVSTTLGLAKALTSGLTHLVIEHEVRERRSANYNPTLLQETLATASQLVHQCLQDVLECMLDENNRRAAFHDALVLGAELFTSIPVQLVESEV